MSVIVVFTPTFAPPRHACLVLHGVGNRFLNVTGDPVSQVNHEIDIEIPASCLALCQPLGGCGGQFGTMNLNNYLYTNNGGTGPAYASLWYVMCSLQLCM